MFQEYIENIKNPKKVSKHLCKLLEFTKTFVKNYKNYTILTNDTIHYDTFFSNLLDNFG